MVDQKINTKPFVSSKYRKSDDIILEENGMIISEKEYVADIFKNYFSKIAEGLGFNDPIPNDYHDDDVLLSAIKKYDRHPSITAIKSALKCQHSFCFAETNTMDVYLIFSKMNVKNSVGYDDIPCKFLKIGATPLAGILCQMVNISLNECNFPGLLFCFWARFGKSVVCFLRPDVFQNLYLVLDKDIAARPPNYGWLKIGNLNWIMLISLEPLPLTWARLSIAYHTVCSSLNCLHMG